eukprot:m.424553 g.424553  ORF g.424553 m.424553 type:complete len:174 (+) comp47400_c0_seq1:635-1156(+)
MGAARVQRADITASVPTVQMVALGTTAGERAWELRARPTAASSHTTVVLASMPPSTVTFPSVSKKEPTPARPAGATHSVVRRARVLRVRKRAMASGAVLSAREQAAPRDATETSALPIAKRSGAPAAAMMPQASWEPILTATAPARVAPAHLMQNMTRILRKSPHSRTDHRLE